MDTTRYEIIVEVNGENQYLDTYKYEPVTLTYNVADIQDISKRNSSFSRTITLPETKNNREVFNNISDLSSDSTFNPNLKARAWILVDTIIVFEGFLQLRSVTLSDSRENTFEVVIFADNDTFFTRLGESYIEDLDYSDLNHTWSTQSVIESWTSGQELGYFYPLIDYGQGWTIDMISPGGSFSSATNSYVNITEIFPATYVKTIWDKIFNEVGFSYESNFINSQKFKDLLIPYNGNGLNNGPTFSQDYIFRVGSATPSLQVMTASSIPGQTFINNFNGQLKFNNLNSPNGDPNGFWNITDFTYLNNSTNLFKQRFGCYLDIDFNFSFPFFSTGIFNCSLKFYRKFNPDGTLNSSWSTGSGSEFGSVNLFSKISGGNFIPNTGVILTTVDANTRNIKVNLYSPILDQVLTQNILQPILNTEEVRFTIVCQASNGVNIISSIVNDGYIFNEVFPDVVPNGEINYSANVPKKIKQKDFITSLIKMFNLYVEPSKDYPNTLIIEPRDDYYSAGQIKDWTDKIDLNVDIKTQILADTQNKEILFTYKDDKDRLNTLYKSTYNEIYGQEIYFSENEFTKSTKKIDVIFSPTPIAMVPGSFNFPIPRIVKDEFNYNQLPGGRIDPNIRIVRRYNDGNNNGLLPFNNTFDSWGFENIQFYSYPYVGHYDNPYEPNDDINWGQLLEQYFPSTIVTNNNLVNNYWLKFLNETMDKDSRIITVELYLTPTDINNFRFNDTIYLFFNGSGHYYKVNKISNYDPGVIKTCEVELIKSLDRPPIKPVKRRTQRPGSVLTTFSSNVINMRDDNVVISGGAITTGTGNVIRGNDIVSNGSNNNVTSNNTFVNGDRNFVNLQTKSIIINGVDNNVEYNTLRVIVNGDENLISASSSNLNINGNNNIVGTGSSNIQVFGSNNTVSPGLTNSIVFGDGVVATQSNQTYIGNNVVITGGGSLPPSTPPDLQGVLDEGSSASISTYFDVTTSNNTGLRLQWSDGTNFTSIEAGGNTGIDLVTNNDNTPTGNGSINLEVQNTGVIQLYNLGSGSNNVGVDILTSYLPTNPTSVKINDIRFFNYFTGAGTVGATSTTINEICKLKIGANFIKIYVTAYQASPAVGHSYEITSCWTWDGTTATQQGGGDLVVGHGSVVGAPTLITGNTGNTINLSITGVVGYTLTWSAIGVLY